MLLQAATALMISFLQLAEEEPSLEEARGMSEKRRLKKRKVLPAPSVVATD
jgi:hypothetical protein